MSNLVSRAGRFETRPEEYRAFIPSPLPPEPPVVRDSELDALLSKADLALGRLDGSILPNPDFFVAMYVRYEAVLSPQIEGTQGRSMPNCSAMVGDRFLKPGFSATRRTGSALRDAP